MNLSEFETALKAGQIAKLLLVEGSDEYRKEKAIRMIRDKWLPEGLEALNETVLDDPERDALLAAAETLPFMADKRLVFVRNHRGLTSSGATDEDLCSRLPGISPDTIVVFSTPGKADIRKKLTQTIKKHGQVLTLDEMKGDELSRWISAEFALRGVKCSVANASLLSFIVGTDSGLLSTEMDKLAAACIQDDILQESLIRELATPSLECRVFDLVEAVVNGKQAEAFRMTHNMLQNGEQRIGILAMLLRQYRMMQHVRIMQYEKLPMPEIVKRIGGSDYAVKKYAAQARSYTGGQIKQAVQICLDTEYAIKAGQINEEGSL